MHKENAIARSLARGRGGKRGRSLPAITEKEHHCDLDFSKTIVLL
jgi:hypothetical protein